MTSGGNNFNYFAENQLTKFSARDAEISITRNFQEYFSRTFQDLKLQFLGLSRTKVIFLDFTGPGILKEKIPDFPGGVGTLNIRSGPRTPAKCTERSAIVFTPSAV